MVKKVKAWHLTAARQELLLVCICAAVVSLAVVPQAYHMDEPEFLYTAAQILRDPLHPLQGLWPGTSMPLWQSNTNPLLWPYLLAPMLRLTGGLEWLTRLLFLPFDVAAAAALYLLAARRLSRPFWPTIALLACPAWALDIGHLMGEKPFAAFALWGLYGFLRPERRWRVAGAALLALACLTKYAGLALVAACGVYALWSGWPVLEVFALGTACVLPVAGQLIWQHAGGAAAAAPALAWGPVARGFPAVYFAARLRQLLCFASGSGVAVALPAGGSATRRRAAFAAAGASLLFLPAFDFGYGAPVRLLDRGLGWLLAFAALLALQAAAGLHSEQRKLWLPWLACWAALLMFVYPAISARSSLFLVIPLTLAAAAALEDRGRGLRLWPATTAAAALLSAALLGVDAAYAGVAKDLAAEVSARYPARSVWYGGYWGMQYYFDRIGARLVASPAWEGRRGDVLIVSYDYARFGPSQSLKADISEETVRCPIPLRLIDLAGGQANFYGPTNGFLPFAFSRKPLARFQIAEIR